MNSFIMFSIYVVLYNIIQYFLCFVLLCFGKIILFTYIQLYVLKQLHIFKQIVQTFGTRYISDNSKFSHFEFGAKLAFKEA
jgi:hypothetical protein